MTPDLQIKECLDQLRYARAAELARTGSYIEAEALLAPNGRFPESPRELDLLARIAAQQERFDDAARLWSAALERDQDNASYKDYLQQLSIVQADGQSEDSPRNTILPWSIAACAILTLMVVLLSTRRTPTPQAVKPPATANTNDAAAANPPEVSSTTTKPIAAPATIAQAQPILAESFVAAAAESAAAFRRLEQRLDEMQQAQHDQIQSLQSQFASIQATNSFLLAQAHTTESTIAHLAQSIADVSSNQAAAHQTIQSVGANIASLLAAHTPATNDAAPPPPVLAGFNPTISSITITATTNGCFIGFDKGLFDRDCHFNIGAKARLEAVAKALVQTQTRMRIKVIGLAEDEPPTWPWSPQRTPESLGLQRAQCVINCVVRLGIFPPDKLSAVTGTSAERPFPSPNRKNRTVMLHVLADPAAP